MHLGSPYIDPSYKPPGSLVNKSETAAEREFKGDNVLQISDEDLKEEWENIKPKEKDGESYIKVIITGAVLISIILTVVVTLVAILARRVYR